MKCDGTHADTIFHLSAKRTSTFKLAGVSVQSTAGSRGVRISGNNAGYTKFRGSVKSTGYPLHSPVSPSLPLLCFTMCHHISTGLYSDVYMLTSGRFQFWQEFLGMREFDLAHWSSYRTLGTWFMIAQQLVSHEAAWIFNWWRAEYMGLTLRRHI